MKFPGQKNQILLAVKKLTAILLILLIFFGNSQQFFQLMTGIKLSFLNKVEKVYAAEVQIDGGVSTAIAEHIISGAASVFISDQVGYKFYVDGSGDCAYASTTNAGTSWSAAYNVFNLSGNDCTSIVVWYDRWTPGDTGNYIHMVAIDPTTDDLLYNRLDTTNNTLLLASNATVNTTSALWATTTLVAGGNFAAITKGTDGTIYVGTSDAATDAIIAECTTSCESASNWSETGTTPLDAQADPILLLPQASGNIMLIRRDTDNASEDIESIIWDNAGGQWDAGGWDAVDGATEDNTTYDVMMSAVVNNDFEVFLAYIDAELFTTANHDIRIAKYSSGSWTNKSDLITNDTRGLTNVAIGLDANTDDVYVAYSARATIGTPATANVYWASSTSAMNSWSVERGPLNSTTENIAGVDINNYSDQRVYVSWYGETTDDMLGDTLADVTPVTVVSATGSQFSLVRASTTNFYTGGSFVVTENVLASRNVTSITITENGTIDGSTGVANVKLFYDLDTTAPYNCASESYGGGEDQFGNTDTNGFSGANGTSQFSDVVAIGTGQSLCVYTVLDVVKAAVDATTLDVTIANPSTDVVVASVTAIPDSAINIAASTTIGDDDLTLTHYHWRLDDNNEALASSATVGSEDTPISALQTETPRRLRIGLSNEGSTTTLPNTFRLEYGTAAPTCNDVASWTDVGSADDAWNMFDSSNLSHGANTTDVAVGSGGVTDENTTFLGSNGGVRDTGSQTGSLIIDNDEYTALEYSVVASTSAIQGNTYCFRVTDQGTPISTYDVIPQVTISADVSVRATSTQIASVDIPTNNFYIGGAFTITENISTRNVTSITLTENGTVDGSVGVDDVRLYYDVDTSVPYDCVSESYGGGESLFGSADTDGFSSDNGTSTFTGSLAISTTNTMCVYVVLDVNGNAQNGETIDITINSGSADVLVSGGGSVAPSTPIDITSSTTLVGSIMNQFGYHWRLDNGTEVTASSSPGTENTPQTDFPLNQEIRLRLGINNGGATSSVATTYELEYGAKITTCGNVSVWTGVGDSPDAWDMLDSPNLTQGANTTDVSSTTEGGVSNPGGQTFLSANAGVRDTTATTGPITLSETQFAELEFSITSTATTSYETNYCFRVVGNNVPLPQYDNYAELTTSAKRDFRVQRGTTIVTGTGVTVTAGPTTYTAPASTSSAFVRITNMHHTGAGRSVGDNSQEANRETVYISNASDITSSFTLSRFNATDNSVVSWEIVEFIGEAGTDNEMIVRAQATTSLSATNLFATGTSLSSVADDSDVVVFITGSANSDATANAYYNGQATSQWNASTNEPVFERIGAVATTAISYAVVEFKGINWKVQRAEHQYNAANTTETESITPVNSITRTFLHTQKRMGALIEQANFGHEVWLSSMGAISFKLSLNAATSSGQVSVAWVVENTQTSQGFMKVQQSSGSISNGTEPRTTNISINQPVSATNNTSLFSMSAFEQNTTNYPRVLGGVILVSTTTYQIYNSDIVTTIPYYYRTEVVEWPTTGLSVRQNYYRFYVDNDALDPTDPWPLGASDLGENTSITALDEPVSENDRVRMRISLLVSNATLPAGLRTLKLQYGERTSTCTAIETWTDVGAPGSGAIWRGYDTSVTDGTALSGDPPTGGDLNLTSVSDVAGRLVEANPSSANPFDIDDGEDVEYDFVVEHNGASESTFYCFRVVDNNGTLLDGYQNYPQLRTAGFTPVISNWRWYSDEENETPLTPLSAENSAPIDIGNTEGIALRVVVDEIKNVSGNNIKFKLQYSENPDFTNPIDVVATSSCLATSTWCYTDGGGSNNSLVSTATISDTDSCIAGVGDGCGTHNESPDLVAGHTHPAGASSEYSFILQQAGARVNAVYYFRLYDVTNSSPLVASSTYPSVVTEGGSLTFTLEGVASAQATEGVITDVTTTPTAIPFGSLPFDTDYHAAYRLTVDVNATQGYQMFMYANQDLLDSYGNIVQPISGTNDTPVAWGTGCTGGAVSCFGYHVGDDALAGGSTRFSPNNSYAAISTSTPEEVMFSGQPVVNESSDLIFRIRVSDQQPAGLYQNDIVFISVPVF